VTTREAGPRTPANAASFPSMMTYDLITRHRASTDSDEAAALVKELMTRQILVDITVDETEDKSGDEVYVKARSGDRSRETKRVEFDKGMSKIFGPIPLADLWPLADKLYIDVFEWDLVSREP
jgi:hypothetical protein